MTIPEHLSFCALIIVYASSNSPLDHSPTQTAVDDIPTANVVDTFEQRLQRTQQRTECF